MVRSGDELERLSVALNHMISRLEDAIHGSKQFVADASHELRTPLTVMRGELESLAQDAQLEGGTRETLGSVLEEVDRLAKIVEGLFALSRLDAGETQLGMGAVRSRGTGRHDRRSDEPAGGGQAGERRLRLDLHSDGGR